MMIGFKDKKGLQLSEGDKIRTCDRTGKEWTGTIVKVDLKKIGKSPIVDKGKILYGFQSSNLLTWINDQNYASELEIVSKSLTKMQFIASE